ncbi:MAG: sulfatase-like hydrolase/transferase [Litorilinea sp.]
MLPERPNIILIMTDQQRADTLAAWGHDHMITPNMDRLAREGVAFRQAYCPGATCITSRAAMFTGMYPHTTGVYTFQQWANHRSWVQDLADAGYRCINMGKMHHDPIEAPGGFMERVVVENPTNKIHANGGSDDDWGRYLRWHGQQRPNDRHRTDPDWVAKGQGVPWHLDERYHSDVFIGTAAESWIRDDQGQAPLFLQIGLTGPHEPWDPLPRHLEQYAGRTLPKPILRAGELAEKPPQHQAHLDFHANTDHESRIDVRQLDAAGIDWMRRNYYANITTVDEQVGRILAALEAKGYLENSLIIFCSDHGELLGDHGLSYKWLMYDPIVHVPLIMWHPGTVNQPGSVSDLVSLIDIGPTILELAGIQQPTYLEGRSLLGYLPGMESAAAHPPRTYVYAEDNYQIMQRSATHKLVYYIGQTEGKTGGQPVGELYDLAADPHELENLWDRAAAAPQKQALLQDLLAWLATSTYYNSGYKTTRARQYNMRWPSTDNAYLHGATAVPKAVDHL